MSRPSDSALDRRSFLKATAGVGALGLTGYAATMLSSDREESTLRVLGRASATTYTVVLSDADASGGGSDDQVNHTGGKTRIRGSIDEGVVETYDFTGHVDHVSVEDGHAGFEVDGVDWGSSMNGALNVEGFGYYQLSATGPLERAELVERGGDDGVHGSIVSGTVADDEDRYGMEGEISHVELHSNPDKHVLIQHSHP